MDFELTKQQEMARVTLRRFAETEVKPLAAEVDETERFPRETVEKMAKLGILGIPYPKQYGIRYSGGRAFKGLRDHGRYSFRSCISRLRAYILFWYRGAEAEVSCSYGKG